MNFGIKKYIRLYGIYKDGKKRICDTCQETIPKVGKMKTWFYGACDRESSPEYFDTFPSLLGAKLIEIEQLSNTPTAIAKLNHICRELAKADLKGLKWSFKKVTKWYRIYSWMQEGGLAFEPPDNKKSQNTPTFVFTKQTKKIIIFGLQ